MEARDPEDFCFPQLNTSCKRPGPHPAEKLFIDLTLVSFSLLTVALNLLVIIAVSHFRQLHSSTNILLLSLAVADFLTGLILMPLEIIRTATCWFLGDLVCSLYNSLSFVVTSASVGNMLLISVDRYVAVCDPLRYPSKLPESRVQLCVCLCWLCSALYGAVIMKEDFARPGRYNSCVGECMITVDYIEGIIDLVVSLVVPVSVIVLLYLRVFVVAVSQARAMRSHIATVSLQLPAAQTVRKSELKAARTLGVLIVVFLVCFCPYYCVSLAADDLLADPSASYSLFLFYLNSTLNPVIYGLFYPWFRRAVKLIVTLRIQQPGSCNANIL